MIVGFCGRNGTVLKQTQIKRSILRPILANAFICKAKRDIRFSTNFFGNENFCKIIFLDSAEKNLIILWKVGRAVEGARLENVKRIKAFRGSNPLPSAIARRLACT